MPATIVDRLHLEFDALMFLLRCESEVSLQVTADDCFRKALLLSAASFFEVAITEIVHDFVMESTAGNKRVSEFVRRKALVRQYHTLFDWERTNANKFFAWFGDGFKDVMEMRVRENPELAAAIVAFMEIGRERNRLVHQNYGHFALEKTAEEIFALYEKAKRFVDELPILLREQS